MGNFVIIGGTKGIGLSIVNQLANEGHKCYVMARNINEAQFSDTTTMYEGDILNGIPEGFLPDTIDGLVYCPGSITLKPIKSLNEDQFIEDYKINVIGAVKTIKACLPRFTKDDTKPSIILFSTVASSQGMPFHASIASAKAGVEGLTISLAAELAPHIRVNAIAPSITNTPLASKILSNPERIEASAARHPLKNIGASEDLAAVACFLLSPQAKWITGQIIHVDGGLSTIKS